MHKTVQKTTDSSASVGAAEVDGVGTDQGLPLAGQALSDQTSLTAAELLTIKDEKLTAIRRAIEKGDYDSDAILKKAIDRMLERLKKTENEQ